jgi:hypothetical protein
MVKYCDKEEVKNRLLIDVDTYDDDLDDAIEEASRYIDSEYTRYDGDVFSNPSTLLSACCADLSAGTFKRRMMPQDVDLGWWQHGRDKLDKIIKSTVKKGKVVFV